MKTEYHSSFALHEFGIHFLIHPHQLYSGDIYQNLTFKKDFGGLEDFPFERLQVCKWPVAHGSDETLSN
jgi:hypothetical protein